MQYSDLQERIEHIILDELIPACTLVEAEKVGLDRRCGYILIGEDFVASCDVARLEYYGGFEYVHEDNTLVVGNYKLYYSEDDRVAEIIDRFNEAQHA